MLGTRRLIAGRSRERSTCQRRPRGPATGAHAAWRLGMRVDAWLCASTEKCPSAIRLYHFSEGRIAGTIVIGADTHKRSHTVAAVDAATGRLLDEQTIAARRRSFEALLIWARGHGGERVWAIEDCRHVSGALERFLLARGEAVVRVAPKLTAGARSFGARARASPTASTPPRSPAPRCARALTACPSRGWPARNSRCGCSSIIASG